MTSLVGSTFFSLVSVCFNFFASKFSMPAMNWFFSFSCSIAADRETRDWLNYCCHIWDQPLVATGCSTTTHLPYRAADSSHWSQCASSWSDRMRWCPAKPAAGSSQRPHLYYRRIIGKKYNLVFYRLHIPWAEGNTIFSSVVAFFSFSVLKPSNWLFRFSATLGKSLSAGAAGAAICKCRATKRKWNKKSISHQF